MVEDVLILVRHGQTEQNRAGLLLGSRLDPPLDETGRAQIAALAACGALEAPSLVFSSPLRRAQESAEMLGHPFSTDERWIELDFGDLDGTPVGDAGPSSKRDASWAPPGGESLEQLDARVRFALDELRPRCVELDVFVVTHVFPIKAALAWALGTDVRTMLRCWIELGSFSRIATQGRQPAVLSVNERPGRFAPDRTRRG